MDLVIERSALSALASDLRSAARLLESRREVAQCDGTALGSPLVEAALVETVALLEARRAIVEREVDALAKHPTAALDDFSDLDAAIAAGV